VRLACQRHFWGLLAGSDPEATVAQGGEKPLLVDVDVDDVGLAVRAAVCELVVCPCQTPFHRLFGQKRPRTKKNTTGPKLARHAVDCCRRAKPPLCSHCVGHRLGRPGASKLFGLLEEPPHKSCASPKSMTARAWTTSKRANGLLLGEPAQVALCHADCRCNLAHLSPRHTLVRRLGNGSKILEPRNSNVLELLGGWRMLQVYCHLVGTLTSARLLARWGATLRTCCVSGAGVTGVTAVLEHRLVSHVGRGLWRRDDCYTRAPNMFSVLSRFCQVLLPLG